MQLHAVAQCQKVVAVTRLGNLHLMHIMFLNTEYGIVIFLYICIHRYSSRALMIPFSQPSIGPKDEEASRAFSALAGAQRAASSAVGWAISLGQHFSEDAEEEVSRRLTTAVRARMPGTDPRLVTGYACLLYFAEKVAVAINLFCTIMPQPHIWFLHS